MPRPQKQTVFACTWHDYKCVCSFEFQFKISLIWLYVRVWSRSVQIGTFFLCLVWHTAPSIGYLCRAKGSRRVPSGLRLDPDHFWVLDHLTDCQSGPGLQSEPIISSLQEKGDFRRPSRPLPLTHHVHLHKRAGKKGAETPDITFRERDQERRKLKFKKSKERRNVTLLSDFFTCWLIQGGKWKAKKWGENPDAILLLVNEVKWHFFHFKNRPRRLLSERACLMTVPNSLVIISFPQQNTLWRRRRKKFSLWVSLSLFFLPSDCSMMHLHPPHLPLLRLTCEICAFCQLGGIQPHDTLSVSVPQVTWIKLKLSECTLHHWHRPESLIRSCSSSCLLKANSGLSISRSGMKVSRTTSKSGMLCLSLSGASSFKLLWWRWRWRSRWSW